MRGASASTQNQALSALLVLYQVVLGQHLGWMQTIVRAQRPARLPVVLSRDEVAWLLVQLRSVTWLMASLLYGRSIRVRRSSGAGGELPHPATFVCDAPAGAGV